MQGPVPVPLCGASRGRGRGGAPGRGRYRGRAGRRGQTPPAPGVRELESVGPFTGSSLYPPLRENGAPPARGCSAAAPERGVRGPAGEGRGRVRMPWGLQRRETGRRKRGTGRALALCREGSGGPGGRNWSAAFLRLCGGMSVSRTAHPTSSPHSSSLETLTMQCQYGHAPFRTALSLQGVARRRLWHMRYSTCCLLSHKFPPPFPPTLGRPRVYPRRPSCASARRGTT